MPVAGETASTSSGTPARSVQWDTNVVSMRHPDGAQATVDHGGADLESGGGGYGNPEAERHKLRAESQRSSRSGLSREDSKYSQVGAPPPRKMYASQHTLPGLRQQSPGLHRSRSEQAVSPEPPSRTTPSPGRSFTERFSSRRPPLSPERAGPLAGSASGRVPLTPFFSGTCAASSPDPLSPDPLRHVDALLAFARFHPPERARSPVPSCRSPVPDSGAVQQHCCKCRDCSTRVSYIEQSNPPSGGGAASAANAVSPEARR